MAVRVAMAFAAFAVVAGPMAGSAAADVLVDQTTGTPGGFVPSEQFAGLSMGECGFSGEQTCMAADDFTVPPGLPWQLQGIDVLGQGSAPSVLSKIYSDAGGLPGSPLDVPGFGQAQPGAGERHLQAFGVLQPGRYWLAVAGSGPTWSWGTQAPQSGYEGAWQSAGCAGGAWQHLSACGQPGPDLRFRITGQPVSADFELGKPKRKHNGGFLIVGTFPGVGKITLDRAGGRGKNPIKPVEKNVAKTHEVQKRLPIDPAAATKKKLKKGEKVKVKVKITYRRIFGLPGAPGYYAGEPNSKTLKVVLFQK
jgi:hypothetical protein